MAATRTVLIIPLVMLILLIPGLTAATPLQTQPSSQPSCSTTGLVSGSQGSTFTVCISESTVGVGELANITMTMSYPSQSSAWLLYYKTTLSITNNGSPVYSASDSCPVQWCTVYPGQNYTVNFPWTVTQPEGIDNVQGTIYWDYGCRMEGCLIYSPMPASTAVNATIQSSPNGGQIVSIDKLALLAPYMVAFLALVTIAVTLYFRRFRLRRT